MIVELGHFALILAFVVAVLQMTVPLVGAQRRDGVMMSLAGPAAVAQFLLIGGGLRGVDVCLCHR